MKKTLIFIIIFVLVAGSLTYGVALKDIQNHWARNTVEFLIERGVINGYDDGTFKPENNVNVDAFIKMTVTALGYDLENGQNYWASPFIDKAKELGLVAEGELDTYARPITRAEMARIIVRALEEEYPDNLDAYKALITDYDSIDDTYKDYIVKAYAKGIITGYEDGSFKPEQNATRAEAAAMIVRMLDAEQRKVPELEDTQFNAQEEQKEDEYTMPSNKDDYYTINKNFPARLYEYEYNKNIEVDAGFFVTNKKLKEMYKRDDEWDGSGLQLMAKTGKGFIETTYTVDYRTIGDIYKWDTLYYYSPTSDFTYNGERMLSEKYIDALIQEYKDNQLVSKATFDTDTSLIYRANDGTIRIRGIMKYIINSPTNTKYADSKGLKLDTWYLADVEVVLQQAAVRPDWEHAKFMYIQTIFLSDFVESE